MKVSACSALLDLCSFQDRGSSRKCLVCVQMVLDAYATTCPHLEVVVHDIVLM